MAIVRFPSGWVSDGSASVPLQAFLDGVNVPNGSTVRPPAALTDPIYQYDSFKVNNKTDILFEPEPGKTFTILRTRPPFTRIIPGCHITAGLRTIDCDTSIFTGTDVGRAVYGPGIPAGVDNNGFEVVTVNSGTRITIREVDFPISNLAPTTTSSGPVTILLGRPSLSPLTPLIEVNGGSGIRFHRILGIGSSPAATAGLDPGTSFSGQHFVAFYASTDGEVYDCNVDSVMGKFVYADKVPTGGGSPAKGIWVHHNRMGSYTVPVGTPAVTKGILAQARVGGDWVGVGGAQDIAVEDNVDCYSGRTFVHCEVSDAVIYTTARVAALRNDVRRHTLDFFSCTQDYRHNDFIVQDNTDRTADGNVALRMTFGFDGDSWTGSTNPDRRKRLLIKNNQALTATPNTGGHKIDIHGWVNVIVEENRIPYTAALTGPDTGVVFYCSGNYKSANNDWGIHSGTQLVVDNS